MALTPRALLRHLDDGTPWSAGSDTFDSVAGAYRLALQVRALRQARGERPRGWKIGFTNRTLWQRYGVFAPMWGTVWDTTLADGAALPLARLCQPRIEPEAVFGFRATPPPGATPADLYAALDWIAPGFEIVQSHRPNWAFDAAQTVADSGLHGRLLVGTRVPIGAVAPDADALHARLAAASVTLSRDGTAVDRGSGANVLDSPLHALLHFLAELRSCPGAPDIAPGDIVTTGTWTDAWPVAPGQHWRAAFDDPALGVFEATLA